MKQASKFMKNERAITNSMGVFGVRYCWWPLLL